MGIPTNGNGIRGMFQPALDELDVRVGTLLTALNDHAQSIAESVNKAETSINRDKRAYARATGLTAAANTAIVDFGSPVAQGNAWLIKTISFIVVGAGGMNGFLYLDDPLAASDVNIVAGSGAIAAQAVMSPCEIYVPNGRSITAKLIGSAVGQSAICAIHYEQLTLEG